MQKCDDCDANGLIRPNNKILCDQHYKVKDVSSDDSDSSDDESFTELPKKSEIIAIEHAATGDTACGIKIQRGPSAGKLCLYKVGHQGRHGGHKLLKRKRKEQPTRQVRRKFEEKKEEKKEKEEEEKPEMTGAQLLELYELAKTLGVKIIE
jgi:hypothetical protein